MGKVNLHSTGKRWENTEISHIFRCLRTLKLKRTHANPNVWECTNSHIMEVFGGKPYHSQIVGSSGNYKTQIIHRIWVMHNSMLWEYYGKN